MDGRPGSLESSLDSSRRFTDRLFAVLMVVQWCMVITFALVVSPRTWIGTTSELHVHVWAATLLGAAIASLPIGLAVWAPGRPLTRQLIAAAQMMFSALLIHATGGRIETHFHVFGSLAFLAFYRDWRVLATATAVITVDHLFRGIYFPQSVFGVIAPSQWRWVEHAAWVLAEDTVLWISIRQGLNELALIGKQQADLERARAEADAASEAKTQFLANVSHEIRTPMTAILGYADELLEGGDLARIPAERLAALDAIRRNGSHLLGVINDVLDLSKIEAGQLTLERGAYSPIQTAADVCSMMRVRAHEKQLQLHLDHSTPVPATITGDALRVRQVLINLIGNAIKFTESGHVSVAIRLIDHDTDPKLCFEVSDTGIGMREPSRLFGRFSQADESTTRKFGGTGLGLNICRRLVDLMEGDIQVQSTPGEGSTFTVALPVDSLDELELAHNSEPSGQPDRSSAKSAAEPDLKGRILLAEDSPDNQRLIRGILESVGAEVELASNGQVALQRALEAIDKEKPFDLILMDIQMPLLDGLAATRALRKAGYESPIVALTAHAMDEERDRCLSAGCDEFATKPISRRELVRIACKFLEERK